MKLVEQEKLSLDSLPATATPTPLPPEDAIDLTPIASPTVGHTPTPDAPLPGSGTILRQVWSGISGHEVSHLTENANYPDTPSFSEEITLFEAEENFADQYGQRIIGYVHPPVTGSYQFWIASDNKSELWLSSSEDPDNVSKIAFIDGVSPPQNYDTSPDQASNTISLTAGQRYFIMAIHKELDQGDHLSVAWAYPGQSRTIIPGEHLSPYGVVIEPTPTLIPTETPTPTATPTLDGSETPVPSPTPTVTGTPDPPSTGEPTISIADVSQAEGDGETTFSFEVSLSKASPEIVSVSFATVDGEAKAGQDYAGKWGKLSIAPGQTSINLNITVYGDAVSEQSETFFIELSDPTNAILAEKDSAMGTIVNDDGLLVGPDTKHIYLPFVHR